MQNKYLLVLKNALSSSKVVAFFPAAILSTYLVFGQHALVVLAMVASVLIPFAAGQRDPNASIQDRDPLTNLVLRDGLIAWVDRFLTHKPTDQSRVAVITLSIDDLDMIEERFGRAMHDVILLETVRRLKGILRDDDALSRSGHFISIGVAHTKEADAEVLTQLVRRLKSAFEEPFSVGPTRTYCSVSLGVAAEVHVPAPSGDTLINAARRACEIALASGPGAVRIYSDELARKSVESKCSSEELARALDTNEIFAWFQPQLRASDGTVIGFEALARWNHPERGLISPVNFLPEIEKSGLSQRLAEVVLKQSLMALNAWDAAGFHVATVSVNFAQEELKNPRFPDFVRWELDRHNIAPERLVVEVLETVASTSSDDVIARTLTALSRIGCKIDLDDFGTGVTCFMNIQRFDVDRIKIDRSLVNQIDIDDGQHAMFSALIAFGNQLGVETLAEGVETEGEIDTLKSLGCGHMQGYAICRPLPLGETLLWLEDHKKPKLVKLEPHIRGAG